MALLGWNPGTEKELFTLDQLVKEFSLKNVQKSGAVFNVQRLDYLNGLYIREKSTSKLVKLLLPYLPESAGGMPAKALEKIVEAYKARLKKLSDITELTDFFFVEKLSYDKKLLAWKEMGDREIKESLEHSAKIISEAKKFDKKSLGMLLVSAAEKYNAKNRGYLLWPLRVALSGKENSASPFEIAEILGKEKTLQRIQDAINLVS